MRSLALLGAALAAGAALVAAAGSTRASYGNAQIIVSGGDAGAVPARATAAYPKSASNTLSAKADQFLHVTFSVKDAEDGSALAPHQAFVRLTHETSGVASYFVAKPDAGGEAGQHKLELRVGDRKALRDATEPGTYAVAVIVGDASLANPVEWSIGRVTLSPPAAPVHKAPPLYTTPLLHESDTALGPLREIKHTFRAPERRPPAAISLAAAGAVVAIVVGWVLYVLALPGWRWAAPLTSGAGGLWVLGFHGSFGAVLALFLAYWLAPAGGLDMIRTLALLAVLAAPLAFFMHRLLATLQARDDATAAKAAKSE